MATVTISDWRPISAGKLIGTCTATMPDGMVFHEVCVFAGKNGLFASPPSKPLIGRDGTVMRNDAGKAKYATIIEFQSRELQTRWSDAVVAAFLAAHPELAQ